MKFVIGVHSLDIAIPANYPYKTKTRFVQVSELSASGVVHVESFGVKQHTLSFKYTDLPKSDTNLLLSFFENRANGIENVFELTDDEGKLFRECRFSSPTLDIVNTFFELYSVSFAVEVIKE